MSRLPGTASGVALTEPSLVATQQLAFPAFGLSFSYPSSWSIVEFSVGANTSATPITSLSNAQPSHDSQLAAGGVAVTWRAIGAPLTNTGTRTMIGGRVARIGSGPATGSCSARGGSRVINVAIARHASLSDNLVEMTACIAESAPDQTTGHATAQVMAMLDSVRLVG